MLVHMFAVVVFCKRRVEAVENELKESKSVGRRKWGNERERERERVLGKAE